MKNEYLAAALLAIAAVAITFGTNSPGSNHCSSPASVEALFAPCQYSKQAAQIALRPEEEPIAATMLAAR
jgi:hypothetical protein